jgi:hypothetical protein
VLTAAAVAQAGSGLGLPAGPVRSLGGAAPKPSQYSSNLIARPLFGSGSAELFSYRVSPSLHSPTDQGPAVLGAETSQPPGASAPTAATPLTPAEVSSLSTASRPGSGGGAKAYWGRRKFNL